MISYKEATFLLQTDEISYLPSRNNFLISLRIRSTQEFSTFQSLINRISQLIEARIKLRDKKFLTKKERERKRKKKDGSNYWELIFN